jgi:hypothetical protein
MYKIMYEKTIHEITEYKIFATSANRILGCKILNNILKK